MTNDFDTITETASTIEQAFDATADRIEAAFERAARSGEMNFSRMTDAILRDLTRLATQRFIEAPLNQAIDQAVAGLPFFGARAAGGPVTPGGSYLVGEQGPELFTPSHTGTVEPIGHAVTVHVHLTQGVDATGVERSEGRISRALARAVAKGSRHL